MLYTMPMFLQQLTHPLGACLALGYVACGFSINWYRLAFIFLPAAIRGDIMYLSFFLPFLFGPILQRVVRTFVTLYDKTDNIKVDCPSHSARSFCWYKDMVY